MDLISLTKEGLADSIFEDSSFDLNFEVRVPINPVRDGPKFVLVEPWITLEACKVSLNFIILAFWLGSDDVGFESLFFMVGFWCQYSSVKFFIHQMKI